MNKFAKRFLLLSFLSLIFLTGCGGKDEGEDTHYKPSEFKHDVALNKASAAIEKVDRDLLVMGAETPADVVHNTYKESLVLLKENLTNLENTQKLLSEDKDLTSSEIRNWNSNYETSIQALKNNIKMVEKKQEDFLK